MLLGCSFGRGGLMVGYLRLWAWLAVVLRLCGGVVRVWLLWWVWFGPVGWAL